MQYTLFLLLSLALVCCLLIYRNDITAPSISFCFPFVVCTFVAILNITNWSLNLNLTAFLIVLLGVLSFILGTFTIKYGSALLRKNKHLSTLNDNIIIDIPKIKLLIFLIFQILVRILQYYAIRRNVGGGSFNSMISSYHYMSEQNTLTYDPFFIRFGNILCNASGYLLGYILINNYFKNKKNSKLLVFNVIISILGSMFSGQRTDAFAIIMAIFAYYFILVNRTQKWGINFSIKRVTVFLLIIVLFVISFRSLGMLLGRGSDINPSDYFFSYLGAQIKNLSIITSNGFFHSNIWGVNTFQQLYGVIGKSNNNALLNNNYTYNFVNGHPLGNVYSTFEPYFLDFGLKGVVIISYIMGMFSQYVYGRVKYISNSKNRYIDYNAILYGYIYFPIVFSFFSNKFFEMVFSIRLIYYTFALFLLSIFLLKKNITKWEMG